MASLRDTISKREEEIERLQLLKDPKSANPDRRSSSMLRYGSPSWNQKLVGAKCAGHSEKVPSDPNNSFESYSDGSKLVGDSEEYEERTSNASEAEIDGTAEDSTHPSEETEQPDNVER